MKVNQKENLNRQARKFLLSNCISKRGAEVILSGFTGYINGNEVEDINLIRVNGQWKLWDSFLNVQSISGNAECFFLTKNSIM